MKYYGKEKCRILKEIRAEIAKQNDIEWTVSECKHQGNCKGTCPKCEQEVRVLEEALAKREALGKRVAVVGISAALTLAVTGCDNPFAPTAGVPVDGGMLPPEETTREVDTMVTKGEMIPVTEMGETESILIPGEVLDGEATETSEETSGEETSGEETTAPDETTAEETIPTEIMGDVPLW